MDIAEKLSILADAAKYDAACTSSGSDRNASLGSLGATMAAGCCHSFTPDGRCVSLLKVLFTNVCAYDCAYCVNRRSSDVPRAAFKPRELADLTISFYRRNYIEGLFLSSGVVRNPDYTTEQIIRTLEILRGEHRFRGYIHAKAIPGTSPELIEKLGHLCDRLSVNMELPSKESLARLAPDKTKHDIVVPMRQIKDGIASDRDTRGLMRKNLHYNTHVAVPKRDRAFAPAGQSTQIIIGATPESDYRILNLTSALYRQLGLKRVFYSAYLPVGDSAVLPGKNTRIQLDREHRLFQADWLLRFYGFDVNEIIDADHPFLDPAIDPKANWAINHLEFFPIEVNTASKRELLRVPGIGAKGARSILKARRSTVLGAQELKRLGIAYRRARFFITCNGRYEGSGITWTPEALKAQLSAPIDGGAHGPRALRVPKGQLSLFDSDFATYAPVSESSTDAPAPKMLQADTWTGENLTAALKSVENKFRKEAIAL